MLTQRPGECVLDGGIGLQLSAVLEPVELDARDGGLFLVQQRLPLYNRRQRHHVALREAKAVSMRGASGCVSTRSADS